jgi:hypothetical protein
VICACKNSMVLMNFKSIVKINILQPQEYNSLYAKKNNITQREA